ncbi:MAG: CdaR family protein [Termitinemataceae bacterium]
MVAWNIEKQIKALVHNWPAKVLSLAFAIILSMFHQISILEERYFSVPLVVETSESFVPSGTYQRMVRVTLRGESSTLNSIQDRDLEAFVDATKATAPGIYRFPVQIRKKGNAPVTEPLEIRFDPQEVVIPLDHSMTKVVPVTPSFRGYLEAGYELSQYQLDPSQVSLFGPVSSLSQITDVTTDPIELTGRKENFTVPTKIVVRDPFVTIQGSITVNFTAIIQQSVMIRTFDKVPIIISGLPETFIAQPQVNFGSVKLQGSQIDLEAFTPDYSMLSVDCSDIEREGTYMLPLVVSVPPNFQVIRYEPLEILIDIVRKSGGSGGKP